MTNYERALTAIRLRPAVRSREYGGGGGNDSEAAVVFALLAIADAITTSRAAEAGPAKGQSGAQAP